MMDHLVQKVSMISDLKYVRHMATEGTWGGEPELQAMCEMYNRAAQVYAYDPHDGCHIVREVHSDVRAESSDPETRKPCV